MRKEYVKPVMESENFVANEYVAACWLVECVHATTLHSSSTNDSARASYIIGGNYTDLNDFIASNPNADIHIGVENHKAYKKDSPNANANWHSHSTYEVSSSYYHSGNSSYSNCHPVNVTLHGNGTSANAS